MLVVAIPLILSTATWSMQHFVDRMFLTWYSPETIAAAMPAGMLNFTIISIFMGTAGYVSTFVAQYYGARRYHRIGPALWQGIYISLIGGLVLLCVIPLAEPAFQADRPQPSDSAARGHLFSDPVPGRWCLHRVLCTFRIFQRPGQNLAGDVGQCRHHRGKSRPGLCPDFRSLGFSGAWNQRRCHCHCGGRRIFPAGVFRPVVLRRKRPHLSYQKRVAAGKGSFGPAFAVWIPFGCAVFPGNCRLLPDSSWLWADWEPPAWQPPILPSTSTPWLSCP